MNFNNFDNEKLSALLLSRDMSQKQLAIEIKRAKSTVSEYVNGSKSPGIKSLYRISKVFNVPIDYLLKDSEEIELSSQ